ncbi:MAG: DUF5107 domain-containing protein [Bacteroidetes bacterium]|uniref:DUF5107 domain-containing protein n=1 Tax=Candidatus Cryptobacteroides avicola TaxID=2840757 RepID=A0A940DQY1_9BACT|nr:DUF5107 domain-containing protein [Candidatus Cryptobacteroides avicola]
MKIKILALVILALANMTAAAQTATVKDTVMRTYPFSDPNPVPQPSGVYPYYKYETFAFEPEDAVWKMVVLENDYLRVKIFPEIGGKIWSIYDKTQGKELFYDNDVVKFREIALRGPWTSGGIEFNYGVIGHAPTCSHPVDYEISHKDDGSVSCYIGVQELLTRTRWMVEVNLPKDAVWVRTRAFWHNSSGVYQPYYTWANSGVEVTPEMKLIYPSSYSIAHDGRIFPYPVDEAGRDLSEYSQQNFGLDKSYHPGGSHKNWFGVYWPEREVGMLHYALRDEKLGRKYFSWTQSGQGEIWVGLLTDTRPQYVELQSGRLFNQNLWESVSTPYKQTLFTPYGTDEWNEYWLPFSGIGDDVNGLTLRAAVNVEPGADGVMVGVFALQGISGKLELKGAEGETLSSRDITLEPSESFSESFSVGGDALKSITLDGRTLWSSDSQETDRPSEINKDFSLDSAQGLTVYAKYLVGMRKYPDAEWRVDKALEMDPSLIPALNLKALLCARSMDYEEAYRYADKVLAIDEYDPQANYISGQAAAALGKVYDAMDRFEVAAITPELRSAACTELAKLHFKAGEKELAADYLKKSLVGNAYNVTAYYLLYQIAPAEDILEKIEGLDLLTHFPDVERMLAGEISSDELSESIREELKWQNYIEFAAFYSELGLKDKASRLLAACPEQNALVALWRAWLEGDTGAIVSAESCPVDLVFPFREESAAPLEWAVENGGSWRSRYLLAMLKDFLGHKDEAISLMSGNESDYAPYYCYRSQLTESKEDMLKAHQMDPDEWRYRLYLAQRYYRDGKYDEAIELTGKYYYKHSENFHIGDIYVKSLIAAGEYRKADKAVMSLRILPFEGQAGSHVMYRDIKLHLAAESIDRGRYKDALARIAEAQEWPESLGVGKPYDDLIDTTLENWLTAIVYKRLGSDSLSEEYLSKVKNSVLLDSFEEVTTKTNGSYPELMSMLGNLDASSDKKLF